MTARPTVARSGPASSTSAPVTLAVRWLTVWSVLFALTGLAAMVGCDQGAGPAAEPAALLPATRPTQSQSTAAMSATEPSAGESATPTAKADAEALAWDGRKLVLSDSEWRQRLTPEQYRILRGSGTETCFTGPYHDHKGRTGLFVCAGCELPLFEGQAKFDSGIGWPSFFRPVHPRNVGRRMDFSYGMVRVEVFCNRCDGHLGHVFDDGPPPTGLRYCINGHALRLIDRP